LWIARGVLATVRGGNEGAISVSACENNVPRLISDEERMFDTGVLIFQ
jgi:hypothetical protein